ncbi:TOBE domain-containing protein [Scrofimicrobium sp. R131]|uniref:TOBE domain-containing protein n=1 Tax=Scrofimicrobium appendicitidis TaxID=3079930 RepID=A0AAU7V558_9ACTO
MAQYLISEAATLLGVSSDTVRRWIAADKLSSVTNAHGRQVIEGADLARFAQEMAPAERQATWAGSSARNRAVGLVTEIIADQVMAQVNLQCGPFRFVSLMSREAVEELNLQVGDTAAAVVKATNVIVEVPK